MRISGLKRERQDRSGTGRASATHRLRLLLAASLASAGLALGPMVGQGYSAANSNPGDGLADGADHFVFEGQPSDSESTDFGSPGADEPGFPETDNPPRKDGSSSEEELLSEVEAPLDENEQADVETLQSFDLDDSDSSSLLSDSDVGIEPPYLTWAVRDDRGEPVAGASFQVQGPRSGNTGTQDARWTASNGTTTVTDWGGENGYTGLDQDPRPGHVAINRLGTAGNASVQDGSRYRVRRATTNPPGASWITDSGFLEIPAAGNTNSTVNNARAGVWADQTYDFGEFEAQANQPYCAAGYVYSITGGGQLKQIDPSGNITNVGTAAAGTNMNGLGIGLSGQGVFAYSRTSTGGYGMIVYRFNVDSGTWTRAGTGAPGGTGTGRDQISTPNSIPVGGAVCHCTGAFFMGGFNTAGTEFHLYMYDPVSNTTVSKGKVSTPNPGSGVHNGDIVFDSGGNLYIVRSSAATNTSTSSTLTVFSVLADDLAAATANSTLSATPLDSVAIRMAAANGVAFDSAGKAYLQATPGSNGLIDSFDLPMFTNQTTFVSSTASLAGATDLASCSAPPSIRLQKDVVGRFADTDQFRLKLSDSGQEIVAVTTDGPATGLQTKVAGPTLTQRGATLTIEENFTGSNSYASSYKCVATNRTPLSEDNDEKIIAQGSGISGTVRIPLETEPAGDKGQIVCTFSNSPLKGSVVWEKNDEAGNLLPGSEWTIQGPGFSTNGQVVQDCVDVGSCTGLDKDPVAGQFKVEPLALGSYTLTETKAPDGYVKNSEPHHFEITEEELHAAISADLTINQAQPKLTLLKETCGAVDPENPGDPSYDTPCTTLENPTPTWEKAPGWSLRATGGGAANPLADSSGWSQTDEQGSAGTWTLNLASVSDRPTINIREAADHVPPMRLQEIQCESSDGDERWFTNQDDEHGNIDHEDLSAELTDLQPGSEWTCTFRNRLVRAPSPGNVTWSKVSEGGDRLAGSEWTIEGPLDKPSSQTYEITDCAEESECSPEGQPDPNNGDIDPAPGGFKVDGLLCGNYLLTETKAPLGYQRLEDPITFTINGVCNSEGVVDPNTVIGDVVNKSAAPALPLAGGPSKFTFVLLGGGLLAAATIGGATLRNRRPLLHRK